MTSPRAVVIPFGVPDDGKGLGLGLAALVHSFAQIDGESVALAQLLKADNAGGMEDHDDFVEAHEPGPVEAFVGPQAWKDLAGASPAPPGVSLVVTGAFEPPVDGQGLIQLLVFDAANGRTRARVEAPVDGDNAGRALLAALDEAWSQLDGELGTMRDIGDLSWEALESVLLAERCALHDPLRGGPHDRLAAMLHLGRAIGDAPEARFPATRLAALALDVAVAAPSDSKLAGAALRALDRANHDAPANPDLLEAVAALNLRLGHVDEAEAKIVEAVALEPGRSRLYALLSEVRRARGDLAGALEAIEEGLLEGSSDPLLLTERGIVLNERGRPEDAERAWRMVLDERPLYPPAFLNLAVLFTDRRDAISATRLVDDTLRLGTPHVEILRRALQLALAFEPEGLARAARVARLATSLVDRAPRDAWARLLLARSLAQMGERKNAVTRLEEVVAIAPTSSLAAEAQRGKLALEEPQASLEIDAVLRAAYAAAAQDLPTIAARAKRLAVLHSAWHAHFALGIAERRRERWTLARDAFHEAIRLAPGSTPAHMEIVAVHVALSEPKPAIEHARRALALEGESARTLAVLATALLAAGLRDEAASTIDRSLRLDATDEANRALAERIRTNAPPSSLTRFRSIFKSWRRR